jgi:polyhydroxyalkanoate synthase subunit PhaC
MTTNTPTVTTVDEVADAVAGLDMMLGDAALGPLRRMLPPAGTSLRFAGKLVRRPRKVTARSGALIGELAKIGLGRSQVSPRKGDKRFVDPAWAGNGLLHRAMQAHLTTAQTAEKLVVDAELDWRDLERIELAVTNIADALAPSNNPLLNPLGWKALIDTGGRSAARGLRRMVSDLSTAPRVPSMIEPDAFVVGEDLAVTPGAVVFRTPVFELIQYQPQTQTVRTVPLLMIPPTINKYYIADLAPGRSIAEGIVASGQQVFMMSWRNPSAEDADWGLDTYGQAVVDAMDEVQRITAMDRTALMAFCSGGIITAMVLAHLAATGDAERVAAAAFAVTVLDQERAGITSALLDHRSAKDAIKASARKGYLDGAKMAEVFAWLRPNDLIWNYWVNNYLQGKPPAAFDILYWNADTTRMPAALHRGFIEMAVENSLVTPGAATMLGTPVDLSKIDVDTYVIAGIADHLCKWQSCFQTTQLLGGESRFVLSTSGHIASLINPPGNPKATWRSATDTPSDPAEWLERADTVAGSWWPDFTAWLEKRCGDEVDAPEALGGGQPTLAPAPGTYVFEK